MTDGGSELVQTPLRTIRYALMELQRDVPSEDVMYRLANNTGAFHTDASLRLRCVQLCEALERRTQTLRPREAYRPGSWPS